MTQTIVCPQIVKMEQNALMVLTPTGVTVSTTIQAVLAKHVSIFIIHIASLYV